MRSLTALFALTLLALCPIGCDDSDVGENEEFATGLSKTLTLRFESKAGALTLKSSGKKLTCGARFEGIEGERVTCERSGEDLEVIAKNDGASVVAVRDIAGKRGYYECTRSGEVDGVPSLMKCELTTIQPRGTGGLSSPFDASAEGISVPNSHWVDADHTLLRGMEPRTTQQFDELRAAGIKRVLIFKNATGNDDVGKEIAAWSLPQSSILHVPFKWKDLDGFKTPCEQTVRALRFIRDGLDADKKIFFHCTVGEDRTGFLSALFTVLFDEAGARDAFDREMCERGYGSGNPQKPGYVLGKLEDGLTPLYRSMAYLIDRGVLSQDLELTACAAAPEVPDDFLSEPLECGTSTTLDPSSYSGKSLR